jgi:hypothetical protein
MHKSDHRAENAKPARQPPPLPEKKATEDAGPSLMFENERSYNVGDRHHRNDGEKYDVVVAGLPDLPEPLTTSSHVIGEDPDLDLDVELELGSDTQRI